MYCPLCILGTVNIDGLGSLDMEGLFHLPKHYWNEDIKEAFKFLEEQVGCDVPETIMKEVQAQQDRISKM